MRNPHGLLLVLLALASTACVMTAPPGTAIASDPSGARVLVDGKDSGWVTPCVIDLGQAEARKVTVVLDGFEPREVELDPTRRTQIVAWRQGTMGFGNSIRFPILLPAVDLFLPLHHDHSLAPARVFVRLRAEATP